MILIFGGTTEGRAAVKVAGEGGKPYLYATLGDRQAVETPGGIRLTGPLTADAAERLCRERGVRLLVDAAHPFAEGAHRTVAETARRCGLPVIRYERRPPREADTAAAVWCADYADALEKLEAAGVKRLLALTGLRTIPKLKPFWTRHAETFFRVLDRPESRAEALQAGVPEERLLAFRDGDGGADAETALWQRLAPDAVLTKESGDSGYFPQKVEAARRTGIPLYVVQRPPLPEAWLRVYTEAGLRRRIEELLPGWFPLRSGYTTGTCATAAAAAAAQWLLHDRRPDVVEVLLPGGETASLPVAAYERGDTWAAATVVKEAGDDPDVTNGCRITVRVEPNGLGEIRFLPGSGVGTVTLPGLGIAVGEPAVNPAPRRMIVHHLTGAGLPGADVTVSVEGGEALALKTFNPKLGIVGGISIIGTSGIVRPFSNEAFVAAVVREIDVARATGCRRLVLHSGARSERFLKERFAGLPPQAFISYGNFVGAALSAAVEDGFADLTIGIMIGKAVKLAEGHLDTHSRRATMNREFLLRLAADAGCSEAAREQIGRMTLARSLWTELGADDRERLFDALLTACRQVCAPLLNGAHLSIVLIPEAADPRA